MCSVACCPCSEMIARSRSGSLRRSRQLTPTTRHSSRNRRITESSQPSGISVPTGLRIPRTNARAAQVHHGVSRTTTVSARSRRRSSVSSIVAVGDPGVVREQAALLHPPLVIRRLDPPWLPIVEVEMDQRETGPRRQGPRECALPGPGHPGDDDAAADGPRCIAHQDQCPKVRWRRANVACRGARDVTARHLAFTALAGLWCVLPPCAPVVDCLVAFHSASTRRHLPCRQPDARTGRPGGPASAIVIS